MKKIFTLMLTFACAMFVGVSCTNEGTDVGGGTTPPAEPTYPVTLTVGALNDALSAVGGSTQLAFSLSEEVIGAQVVLGEPSALWLTVEASENGNLLDLSYATNPSVSNVREASFTVSYKSSTDEDLAEPVTVTVKQSHGTPVFSVLWKDQNPAAANAYIHSDDPDVTWLAFTETVNNEQVADEYFTSMIESWSDPYMGAGGIYKAIIQYTARGQTYTIGTGCDHATPVYCLDSSYAGYNKQYLCVVGLANIPESLKNLDPSSLMYDEAAYEAFLTTEDTTTMVTAVHAFEVETATAPSLRVSSEVAVPYLEGSQALDVVVENPYGEGSTVSVAEPECDWLTATYEGGKLTLNYAENPYAVAREVEVELTYTYYVTVTTNTWEGPVTMPVEYTATALVKVSQAKNATVKPIKLSVKVKESHFNGFVVDVTASDTTVPYVLEATWPDGDLTSTFNSKLNNIGSTYNPTTLLTGNQKGHLVKISPNMVEWYGVDMVLYAFAVNEETKAMISDPIQIPVKVNTDDYPVLTLVEENGVVSTDENDYELKVDPGTKVTVKFKVQNPVKGGLLALNGNNISDTWNVIEEDLPVIDQKNQTISFTVSEYDSSKSYHHCNLGLKYTNADGDNWQIAVTLKVVQNEPATAE